MQLVRQWLTGTSTHHLSFRPCCGRAFLASSAPRKRTKRPCRRRNIAGMAAACVFGQASARQRNSKEVFPQTQAFIYFSSQINLDWRTRLHICLHDKRFPSRSEKQEGSTHRKRGGRGGTGHRLLRYASVSSLREPVRDQAEGRCWRSRPGWAPVGGEGQPVVLLCYPPPSIPPSPEDTKKNSRSVPSELGNNRNNQWQPADYGG